jgi:ribosomal protein S18 acetylase RimI-like enzyme
MAALDVRILPGPAPREVYRALAELHAAEISGGFLTSLGLPVLERLYRAIHGSRDAFIVVAEEQGRVVGFLCASIVTKKVYRHVLLTAWPTLLPVLARKLANWGTVRRCWETLRYPDKSPAPELPNAEILNFCVAARRQGAGVGRALFAAMEQEYCRRRVARIRIVTGAQQLSAIRFYEKIGARPAGNLEVHAAVKSRLFVHAIRDCQSAPGVES